MATAFNTQTGNGEYRLQFETDNMDHFLLMQATARQCIDGKPQTHADQIRAMSDEELAEFIRDVSYECQDAYCGHHCSMCAYPWCSSERTMNWLKQPVEVSGDA